MKGTMTYDIVVMVGMLILIFTLIYWSASVGVQIVGDYLLSAPKTVQDSGASYVSMSCVIPGTVKSTLTIEPIEMSVKLNETHFGILTTGKKYSTWKEVERGGSLKLRKRPEAEIIQCDASETESRTIPFDVHTDNKIIILKEDGLISAGVR